MRAWTLSLRWRQCFQREVRLSQKGMQRVSAADATGLNAVRWVGATLEWGLSDACKLRDLQSSSSEASDTKAWLVDWRWVCEVKRARCDAWHASAYFQVRQGCGELECDGLQQSNLRCQGHKWKSHVARSASQVTRHLFTYARAALQTKFNVFEPLRGGGRLRGG